MAAPRKFSHITISTTPFKQRIDKDLKKSDLDIEKDANIAFKCADRFNYNTNFHRKVSLSDRFELVALGFEMKAQSNTLMHVPEASESDNYIYRKEKKLDPLASPIYSGSQNPLPAGRGFLSPPAHSALSDTSVSAFDFKSTPQKSPATSIRLPIRSVFDEIPSNFV
ncbi:unnamed protein product [Caenorhabditis sp. 36 PRJEB53466]|nr:unnamed protein product [Caenorhabditis sp. 36 PRJEB53466]